MSAVEPDETLTLRSFAEWIVAMDEPGAVERRTLTMTKIIEAAKEALATDDRMIESSNHRVCSCAPLGGRHEPGCDFR